jgi:hypothetical protein
VGSAPSTTSAACNAGRLRIRGLAPDRLPFELGVRAGEPPLARYRSGDVLLASRPTSHPSHESHPPAWLPDPFVAMASADISSAEIAFAEILQVLVLRGTSMSTSG